MICKEPDEIAQPMVNLCANCGKMPGAPALACQRTHVPEGSRFNEMASWVVKNQMPGAYPVCILMIGMAWQSRERSGLDNLNSGRLFIDRIG